MNTQHTPGPWIIHRGDALTHFIYDDLGEDGCLEPIASVSHGDPTELEANTRLIAAAPDLLAALEMAAEYLNHPGGARPGLQIEAYEKTREAIAKARSAA